MRAGAQPCQHSLRLHWRELWRAWLGRLVPLVQGSGGLQLMTRWEQVMGHEV